MDRDLSDNLAGQADGPRARAAVRSAIWTAQRLLNTLVWPVPGLLRSGTASSARRSAVHSPVWHAGCSPSPTYYVRDANGHVLTARRGARNASDAGNNNEGGGRCLDFDGNRLE